MPDGSVSTTQTDTKPHVGRGALDRELFCPRLQRLLMGSASELGQRGNLAQVVASIERGGASGGGEDPNLGMLRRLGATDTRGIDNRVGQLRELGQRWHALDRIRQATALALYLGTSHCHPTLREHFGEGQGGLAGVVLYRWQLRQAKGRTRDLGSAGAKAREALDQVRAELGPLEREAANARAVLEQQLVLPEADPRPDRPYVPLVLRAAEVERQEAPWRAAMRAWLAPRRRAREAWERRRQEATAALQRAEAVAPALRARQAELCAELAGLAAVANEADDELALVKLCRGGLEKSARAEMVRAAENDVRGLHRDWYATAPMRSVAHAKDIQAFKRELWG